ncbi:hypothetical protein [Caballeronia sp. LZ016]|uniref:hypothetical protein n=1 Tax=Caballeronia sp. LZ016 TaxID=3038554 RepID=UPI0028648730|nr:hypothetical protein [Caballeronia sp. LZ016]MDR5740239.1 hypothetical protein [Caballeronia sp. LZ016]
MNTFDRLQMMLGAVSTALGDDLLDRVAFVVQRRDAYVTSSARAFLEITRRVAATNERARTVSALSDDA